MDTRTDQATISLAPTATVKSVATKIYGLISSGRAADALACLTELDELGPENPEILKLNKGAILIDIANKLDNAEYAARGIGLITDIDVAKLSESARRMRWYNLGNGYGTLYHLKRIPPGVRRAVDEDFNRARQCYREAMRLGASSPQSTARLYTNYGILLGTVGRHVEEIEAYDEALVASPDFAMALWHKAQGLEWYSRLVERPTKRSVLLEAWCLLKKSLEAGLEAERKAKVEKELAALEKVLEEPKTTTHRHTRHIAYSAIERKYIRFCVDNRLYLHQCPVSSHEAYGDPLSVRLPTSAADEFLEIRSNELALIKQEYIAARFLLFVYRLKVPDLSFVDRGTFLPSLEESEGHIYRQLLILSFRAAYSILDKIADFLNDFCELGFKKKDIYFREEFFLAGAALRPQLVKYDGLQLAALVDVAREFSPDQSLYPLRDLRRKLEHRCLIVGRERKGGKPHNASDEDATAGTAAYALNENDLYESARLLLKAVRATIFYLFYFVRVSVEPTKFQPHPQD